MDTDGQTRHTAVGAQVNVGVDARPTRATTAMALPLPHNWIGDLRRRLDLNQVREVHYAEAAPTSTGYAVRCVAVSPQRIQHAVTGQAKSKKAAKQEAARLMLQRMGIGEQQGQPPVGEAQARHRRETRASLQRYQTHRGHKKVELRLDGEASALELLRFLQTCKDRGYDLSEGACHATVVLHKHGSDTRVPDLFGETFRIGEAD